MLTPCSRRSIHLGKGAGRIALSPGCRVEAMDMIVSCAENAVQQSSGHVLSSTKSCSRTSLLRRSRHARFSTPQPHNYRSSIALEIYTYIHPSLAYPPLFLILFPLPASPSFLRRTALQLLVTNIQSHIGTRTQSYTLSMKTSKHTILPEVLESD